MKFYHKPVNHSPLIENNTLHVIAVISNPVRYKSRYFLYEQFEKHILESENVNLITIELAHGQRQHEITNSNNPNHFQIRTDTELWSKENMFNVGLKLLPKNWQYVAWVDADVQFLNKDWAQATLHALQDYMVVQMFETAIDLGPRNNVINTFKSFGYQHISGNLNTKTIGQYYRTGHSGFAWAYRREFIENVGGMIDKAILGSGDYHVALSLINQARHSMPLKGLHPNYYKMIFEWQKKCQKVLKGNFGYVPISLQHFWHGRKVNRGYNTRWKILVNNKYDPNVDVSYDNYGVLTLNKDRIKLRHDIMKYMRSRNEDSAEE